MSLPGGQADLRQVPGTLLQQDTRQEIRAVMRYAGPRMLYRHPKMALWHLFDGRRQEPSRPEKAGDPPARVAAGASEDR